MAPYVMSHDGILGWFAYRYVIRTPRDDVIRTFCKDS